MTDNSSFKRRVRERMSKTGESYTAARRHVTEKRDRVRTARTKLAAAPMPVSEDKLMEATGKKWDAWLTLLDRFGARDKKHSETVGFLIEKHGIDGWYAQSITVGYERARGLRVKHQKADGFEISASKTIAVSVDILFDAFVEPARRKQWLKDGTMRIRTSRPNRGARFDWEDGTTRVVADFADKGPEKSVISLAHQKLPDADEAETTKAAWRQRLGDLKAYLES